MIYQFKAKQIGPVVYGLSVGYRLSVTGTCLVELTDDIEGAENGLAEWITADLSTGDIWITADSVAARVTASTDATLSVEQGDLRSLTTETEGQRLYRAVSQIVDSIRLDTTVDHTESASVGEIRWNQDMGVPEVGLPNGVTMQIGIEVYKIIDNQTGSTIPNGALVYLDGEIADKSDIRAGETIAMATHEIPDGTVGKGTIVGAVHDFDTSALTPKVVTYLGENGGLTQTRPQFPDTAVEVGYPEDSQESGVFDVRIQSLEYQKGFDVIEQPLGVYSMAESTLAYNPTTRTASITPVGTFWRYFRRGIEHRKSDVVSLTHTATQGAWYFYINAEGTFVLSQTTWDILTCCPLMFIAYDASTPANSLAIEERHGARRNPEWHKGQHFTTGTYYESGLAASGYVLTGSTDADNTFAIAQGVIADEDIRATISALADNGPYRIAYRLGDSGVFDLGTAAVPYLSGTYAQYNQWTGTTWQLTEITNGEFMNIYVVAIPCLAGFPQVIVFIGQNKYASQALAEAAKISADLDFGTNEIAEFCIIHRFTLRGGSGYTTTGKVRLESYKDLRGKTTRVSVTSGVV